MLTSDLGFLCIGRRDGSLEVCSALDLRPLCHGPLNQVHTHCLDIIPWNQSTNQE